MEATLYLLILIAAFIGIIVLIGRKRKARFAKDARIPHDDGKG